MSSENIFLQDWYDCLQAHLGYVVKKNDHTNESSLIAVLKKIGLDDQDIEQVRMQTLTVLGCEGELLKAAEIEPLLTSESASVSETAQEASPPSDSDEHGIIEPIALNDEEVVQSDPPDVGPDLTEALQPPVETHHDPDPVPKPPKHSQMSLF